MSQLLTRDIWKKSWIFVGQIKSPCCDYMCCYQLVFFKPLLYSFWSKFFPTPELNSPTSITTVYIMSYSMTVSQSSWEWTHQTHFVVYHFLLLQTLSSHCLQGSIFLAPLYLTRFSFSAVWSLVIGFLRAQYGDFILYLYSFFRWPCLQLRPFTI